MAVGPRDRDKSETSDDALIDQLEQEIDQTLDRKAGDQVATVRFSSPRAIDGQVAQGLRDRYQEAGWDRVVFRETGKYLGGIHYEMTLER